MASLLALLFLPSENHGYPLTFPQAPHYYALLADASLGLWPRSASVAENLPRNSGGVLDDGGLGEALGPDLRHPAHCRLHSSDQEVQRDRREPRSSYASKRQDGKPNSLDLTFHILREFLEMSRAEKLAQKAFSNKMLLQNIGK
ncbi:hypothetical protein NDU88_001285 [Pleurodeles waltl]|uniref:Corticotropin-releasing factor domain-containing protein n=1 Tax=Pleurodeles waltl TaxID=8319 RepID=A0AAV7P678_PLEWA|nr:hypothetical protein NDU88_001285 [Pleurodeles waltl]